MNARTLDVSELPIGTADSRSLLWWGNLGMMVIEGTMFAMLVAAYLYLRVTNLDWPPGTVLPPDLVAPTVELALFLLALIPSRVIDRAPLSRSVGAAKAGMLILVLGGIAILIVRAMAVAQLGFKWSDHAYGSVIWFAIGMHTFHVIAATGETAILLVYCMVRPVLKHQLLDIRCTAVYWYFVIAMWVPFYAIIYVLPHVARKV